MLFAKQDHPRHDEIHEARAEGTGPAHVIARIVAAADEIDIALSIDLAAAEKERVDTPLRGAIEKLDAAIGEEIMLLRPEDGNAQGPAPGDLVLPPPQHRARRRNRRRRADRDVMQAFEQPRYA